MASVDALMEDFCDYFSEEDDDGGAESLIIPNGLPPDLDVLLHEAQAQRVEDDEVEARIGQQEGERFDALYGHCFPDLLAPEDKASGERPSPLVRLTPRSLSRVFSTQAAVWMRITLDTRRDPRCCAKHYSELLPRPSAH